MRYAVIACQVLQRELNFLSAKSEHIVTVRYLKQGLHNTPDALRQTLWEELARIEEEPRNAWDCPGPDAILLGYGLCSNGVVGLKAGRVPLVVPRTDDCIGIFLGSQRRYLDLFKTHQGIYWYNPGWIETAMTPSAEHYRKLLEHYTELYGEDNAQYLMEETNGWHTKYTGCTYITSQIVDNTPYEAYTRQAAEDMGWNYERVEGSLRMLEALLSGQWDEADFLICPPGYTIQGSYDERKIQAVLE